MKWRAFRTKCPATMSRLVSRTGQPTSATGEVKLERYVIFDDYGRLLDPRQTLGQVHGGVVQGIGQALFEHAVFDAETGQILSGSLMDYALPRAGDLPSFEGSLTP